MPFSPTPPCKQLNIISILSENTNCYKEIYDECKFNNIEHIKIPQDIHIKDRELGGGSVFLGTGACCLV